MVSGFTNCFTFVIVRCIKALKDSCLKKQNKTYSKF
eukprot:UN17525